MSSLVPLSNPPKDAISHLCYSRSSQHLLVSSWDKHISLYSPATDDRLVHLHLHSPVTKCVWGSDSCYATTLDGTLHRIDPSRPLAETIGNHSSGLTCLVHHTNTLYTGGWNGVLQRWDDRTPAPQQGSVNLESKIVALDCSSDQLLVATINNQISILDIRNLHQPTQVIDSQLKYMTRSLVSTPAQRGFAYGSIEGRVGFEFLDESPLYHRFAFKCHRHTVDGTEFIYPVNCLAFHPKHTMTFASGGGDGAVSIWDGIKKKRIRALPRQHTSISSLSFSEAGDQLAIAVSYTYEQGDKPHPPDAIYIRDISDSDVLPRAGK